MSAQVTMKRPRVDVNALRRRRGLSREWKVLLLSSLAVFMVFLDVTIVNIAFPAIRRTFTGTSLSDLSWVLNGYNVVVAALLVPAGRIADRDAYARIRGRIHEGTVRVRCHQAVLGMRFHAAKSNRALLRRRSSG